MWEFLGYPNLDAQNALIVLELQKAEEARLAQLALALSTFICNVIGLLFFTLFFDYVLLLIYYEVVIKYKL